KSFADRTVVDQLNLSVYPGELYALLGDNGAGKTTSISMLTTLLKPTSGDIFICGFDAQPETEKTKGAFGVVSQDVAIYQELTAFENLS
ncbi:ATP-binding cassette domain-containing protein, partial [Acinetobacter baumannii]